MTKAAKCPVDRPHSWLASLAISSLEQKLYDRHVSFLCLFLALLLCVVQSLAGGVTISSAAADQWTRFSPPLPLSPAHCK